MFDYSSFGWCSELLHVEAARYYEPLQKQTETAQMRCNFGPIWESRTVAFVSWSIELLWFIMVIRMMIITIMINNIDNFSVLPSLSSVLQRFLTNAGQSINHALAAVVEAHSKKVCCSLTACQYKSSAPRTWLEWTPPQTFLCVQLFLEGNYTHGALRFGC